MTLRDHVKQHLGHLLLRKPSAYEEETVLARVRARNENPLHWLKVAQEEAQRFIDEMRASG